MQPLTIALGNYGITKPIKAAGANLGRLNLRFVEVEQIVPMMRRMCRGLEFDICEMAFTTYLCARAAGLPFTAFPVFVTRNFHHWAVFINTKSGIRGPKDLEGRKVGVNRGYTVTTGLWARGILHSEYGVDLNKVTWIPTDDEHVAAPDRAQREQVVECQREIAERHKHRRNEHVAVFDRRHRGQHLADVHIVQFAVQHHGGDRDDQDAKNNAEPVKTDFLLEKAPERAQQGCLRSGQRSQRS